MALSCDICGGALQMNGDNTGAVCTVCGVQYSIESLRNKLGNTPEEQPASAQNQSFSANNANFGGTCAAPQTLEFVVERKFDIQAGAYGVYILVDGVEVARLAPKGAVVSLPITPGNHEISAVIKYDYQKSTDDFKKTVAVLKNNVLVGNKNIYGLVKLRRGAFKASWDFTISES